MVLCIYSCLFIRHAAFNTIEDSFCSYGLVSTCNLKVPRFITVSKVPVDITIRVGFLYVGTVKKKMKAQKAKGKAKGKKGLVDIGCYGSKQQHRGDITSVDSAL